MPEAVTFTPAEITAWTIAVSALLATIFTGIVNILAILRTERKLDANTQLTAVIKGSVDGQATAAAGREDALQRELKILREMLADKTQTTDVLLNAVTQSAAPEAKRAPDVESNERRRP